MRRIFISCSRSLNILVPQGGPMSGIGNDFQLVSLSNCFVIGDDEGVDSYGAL
jgi:ribonucleoside-diphosphate reductase alpha chain